jgi:hypothetical protein
MPSGAGGWWYLQQKSDNLGRLTCLWSYLVARQLTPTISHSPYDVELGHER